MANKNVRDTVIAVNMEMSTPRPRVKAKPLMADVPSQKRMIAVIIDEMFESRIESQAREKPSWSASSIDFPLFNSSFILSKIRMLASTAMPIERINPAIPAAVNVTGITLKTASDKMTYITRESEAIIPGSLYQRIRKATIRAKPTRPDFTPNVVAS